MIMRRPLPADHWVTISLAILSVTILESYTVFCLFSLLRVRISNHTLNNGVKEESVICDQAIDTFNHKT